MIDTRAPRAVIAAALCSVTVTGCVTSERTTPSAGPPSPHPPATGETTTATGAQPRVTTAGCPDGEYLTRTFCYLRLAGARNAAIDSDCGPLLSNDLRDPGHVCRNDIQPYQALVHEAQRHLQLRDLPGVPLHLRQPAGWLARAVSDELAAARLAITATHSHAYLEFLNAWGEHGKAGRELQTAAATFYNR